MFNNIQNYLNQKEVYKELNPLLSVENVNLSYGEKVILTNINLTIKDIVREEGPITGQVVSLLGKSGIGKTQLLMMIAAMVKPISGRILVTDKQLETKPGLVGMVLQTYPLFEHRTLLSNIEMVCKDKDKIEYYLNEFDILKHKDKWIKDLSGGQKQRTAIVQQILSSDGFILLDEPFSGLDPVATDKLSKMILKVANQNENNTVIISSHILEPALSISDSVYILGANEGENKGASIKYFLNLAAMGLSWDVEIEKNEKFINLLYQVREIFKTL